MIGRVRRWFRSTGPPLWAVVLFLVVYLSLETLVWFMWGIARALGEPELLTDYYKMRMAAATAAAAFYGLYRLWNFHPIMRTTYRQWLEQTPWTPGKPLPLGSPCLGVADVLLVAVLCWLGGRDYPVGYVAPACGSFAAYYLAACQIAALCGQRVTLYLLAFGLVLAIRLAAYVPAALLALVALYPVARAGVRRSLDPAAWPETRMRSWLQELTGEGKGNPRQLGWPYGLLGPNPPRRVIQWPETALVPLLAGGLAYAILSHCSFRPSNDDPSPVMIFFAIALMCTIRLVAYVGSCRPPISFVGRLVTGQWIILGYDKVFVGPLATLAVFFALEAAFVTLDTPAVLAQPLVVAACLGTWMNVGPTLRDWQLTGQHRIAPSGIQSNRGRFCRV